MSFPATLGVLRPTSNKRKSLVAVCLLLTLCASARAQTWKLKWSDEFNAAAGTPPASADWNFEQGWGPKDNHEIEWYCRPGSDDGPCEKNAPNAYQDGLGNLVIEAIHAGQRWSSARINTMHKHPMLYGRVEARLKLQPGAGFWPAFWLLGENIDTVGWPTCGEQDIMEWVQKYGPTTTSSTVHGPGYSGAQGPGSTFTFPGGGRIDDSAFHTYGMTWSENRMEFYRDTPDKPYFILTPQNLPLGKKWVYNQPFFVILNFAVGESGFGGTVDQTTPATGKMLVDYVRWSQKN